MDPAKRPKRPEQHVLEAASRLAFRNALPTEWVFRDQPDDYGIDGEVEIFERGQAVGRIFKVQVKGTDGERLVARLPIEKEAYLHSLNLPTLIVLYHRPTDRVFARWFQSFDPHYGGRTEKAITLAFSEDDLWENGTAARISGDVETFFRLRDPRRTLPIELSLVALDESVAGPSTTPSLGQVRSLLRPFLDIVQLSPPGAVGSDGRIVLQDDRILVSLRGMASVTLHRPPNWRDSSDPVLVAYEVPMALGVLLARLGLVHASARLFVRFAERSWIATGSDIVPIVAGTLAQTGLVAEALQFAGRLASEQNDESEVASALAELSIMTMKDTFSHEQQEEVLAYLDRRAESALRRGRTSAAAAAHCNAGRWLRGFGRHEEALEHYRDAEQLHPGHAQQGEFHGEVAGSLFEIGSYEQAAERYEHAIALGANRSLEGLLADALMMSGRYREAQERFRSFNADSSEPNPEWQLKGWALEKVRARAGDLQDRDLAQAERLADVSDNSLGDPQRRGRLDEAIKADGLCALAWFNLGLLEAREDRYEAAFPCFLLAAVILRHVVEPWVRAIGLALDHPEEGILKDAMRCAYLFNGDDFLNEMSAVASQMPEVSLRDQLLSELEGAVAAGNPSDAPFEVRILGPGADARVIRIPGDEEGEGQEDA